MRTIKNRRRQGFSLSEMLVVVALLGIVGGLAVVGVTGSQKNLRQKELDTTAKEIYMVAQNRFTALKAVGALNQFANAPEMPTPPDNAAEGGNYCYLSSADADSTDLCTQLLPQGSMDGTVLSRQYVVEYNANNGSVYAVFYSPGGFGYATASLAALRADRNARMKHDPMVGYYGGEGSAVDGDAGNEDDNQVYALNPTLDLSVSVNNTSNDEVALLFTCPKPAGAQMSNTDFLKSLTFTFVTTSSKGGTPQTVTKTGSDYLNKGSPFTLLLETKRKLNWLEWLFYRFLSFFWPPQEDTETRSVTLTVTSSNEQLKPGSVTVSGIRSITYYRQHEYLGN